MQNPVSNMQVDVLAYKKKSHNYKLQDSEAFTMLHLSDPSALVRLSRMDAVIKLLLNHY